MESPSISLLSHPIIELALSLHPFLLGGMDNKKVVVLWLGLHENDDREKQKVLKAVSTLTGLDLIAVDMKECKLTVVGLVDPIELVTKLRRHWRAEILSVGPAKHDTAAAQHGGGAGGVKEEGAVAVGSLEVAVAATAAKAAKQAVVEGPGGADMRSWPHAAVHVYPPGPGPRPRYPYPHQQYGGHPNPYGGAHGGHGGARGNHPNYPYAGRGYYGGQDPNGCTIC